MTNIMEFGQHSFRPLIRDAVQHCPSLPPTTVGLSQKGTASQVEIEEKGHRFSWQDLSTWWTKGSCGGQWGYRSARTQCCTATSITIRRSASSLGHVQSRISVAPVDDFLRPFAPRSGLSFRSRHRLCIRQKARSAATASTLLSLAENVSRKLGMGQDPLRLFLAQFRH